MFKRDRIQDRAMNMVKYSRSKTGEQRMITQDLGNCRPKWERMEEKFKEYCSEPEKEETIHTWRIRKSSEIVDKRETG